MSRAFAGAATLLALALAPVDAVPPLTYFPIGTSSGWNACPVDYALGSSVIANPVWGAGSTIAPDFTKATPSSLPNGTHFLDFTTILLKRKHGVITRESVPTGACLPGNLINVRTSANSYPSQISTPASPIMNAKASLYTTTADNIANPDLSVYQPRSNRKQITVYFALNYGLRNALDNPYDSTGSNPKYTYGGFYVSNLTTALLGDASKGLGRAVTAEVKLCFAPMSTADRKWRKKSGDAKLNKQCLTQIAEFAPPMAVTGLAVSDVAYPPNVVNGAAAISPVKFCRPLSDPTFLNGVNPLASMSNPLDCVKSGQSWKVTKATNFNLADPDWYSVNFTFGDNTAKGVYFVRVFAKDANGSYLGFGSSAGSANLTNNNAQNYFKADPFDAVHSYGKNGEHSFDIQAGAIGCSVMTVGLGTAYFVWEHIRDKRAAKRDTEVVAEAKPTFAATEAVVEPAAAPASQ